MPTTWVFDPVPPSGSRTGGDLAQFAFQPDLDALVRETVQNSNDQKAEDAKHVEVHFRLVEVEASRMASLRNAIDWPALGRHVAGIEIPRERERFRRGHEAVSSGRVVLLWIEDRGTSGLVGPEHGEGNFAALCKDKLFSEKQHQGAGGSYGLGKAVLWRFSQISTVAFYSRLAHGADAGRERFIIKAALPFHTAEHNGANTPFSGDGWFGDTRSGPTGAYAVSLWDEDARRTAHNLGARPFDEDTGTSILLFGFEDPTSEDAPDVAELQASLEDACTTNFWPAIVRDRLRPYVGSGSESSSSLPVSRILREVLETYVGHREAAELEKVGDVVVRTIRFEIPARRDGSHGRHDVEVDLVVRLAHDEDDHRGILWSFRGPGMIIERPNHERVSLSGRPFQAMLVCGNARRGASTHDAHLDAFLREAEPPSHDRWVSTPRLRDSYQRGYKKALDTMNRRVVDELRKLVSTRSKEQKEGPEALKRLFRGAAPGGSHARPFAFEGLSAHVNNAGAWAFRGAVAPKKKLAGPWTVRIDMSFREEGGRATGGTIADLTVSTGTVTLSDGVATVVAPAGTSRVSFEGHTDPARHPVPDGRAAAELVIRSSEGA